MVQNRFEVNIVEILVFFFIKIATIIRYGAANCPNIKLHGFGQLVVPSPILVQWREIQTQ